MYETLYVCSSLVFFLYSKKIDEWTAISRLGLKTETPMLFINNENLFSALMILLGSTFYVIGGILTLKISNKKNENVTASILIWGAIIVCPISLIIEQPWNLNPSLESTLSLIYLGIFPTGIAWLLRFMSYS